MQRNFVFSNTSTFAPLIFVKLESEISKINEEVYGATRIIVLFNGAQGTKILAPKPFFENSFPNSGSRCTRSNTSQRAEKGCDYSASPGVQHEPQNLGRSVNFVSIHFCAGGAWFARGAFARVRFGFAFRVVDFVAARCVVVNFFIATERLCPREPSVIALQLQ